VLSFSILTGPAHAQDAGALRRELEALRRQFATVTESYEKRLRALGDRLQQLEGRAAPAVPSPVPSAPPPTHADEPRRARRRRADAADWPARDSRSRWPSRVAWLLVRHRRQRGFRDGLHLADPRAPARRHLRWP